MENNQIMHDQKICVLDILRKSVLVSSKNINFIIFTFITSIPLFYFLLSYEFFLQKFISETSENLKQPPDYNRYCYRSKAFDIDRRLSNDFVHDLVQLGFLYLVPFHLLELCTILVIVNLASKIYTEQGSTSLKDMVQKIINMPRLRGTFVTFLYVTVLSTCSQLGLIWLVTIYFVVLTYSYYYVLFAALCGASFVLALTFYLLLSAEWNMSMLIAVLEDVYGVEALALSTYFSRGNHKHGLNLMFVFFLWGVVLRLPCLYIGCYEGGHGIVAQNSLFCLGNVLKWVVFVVYFHDCKKWSLEEKVDKEIGTEFKVVDM